MTLKFFLTYFRFWKNYSEIPKQLDEVITYKCQMSQEEREFQTLKWKDAINSTNKSKI